MLEVPPQDVITRDNVTIKVNAVITLRVLDPAKAVIEVANYVYQTSQFAQTTLRSVLGEVELDGLLSHRDALNQRIQTIIDQRTEPWGVKVVSVEVKQVDLPESMTTRHGQAGRSGARETLQDHQRRGRICRGPTPGGSRQSAGPQPITLQLRYLQTLTDIGTEKNTTVVFPLPVELISLLGSSRREKTRPCRRGRHKSRVNGLDEIMRSIQETEEEEHTDTEITLGMRSLLGVFFGLVLICGIFFGLGYSLGRGSSRPTPGPASESAAKPAPKLAPQPAVVSPASEDDSANPASYTPGPDAREPESARFPLLRLAQTFGKRDAAGCAQAAADTLTRSRRRRFPAACIVIDGNIRWLPRYAGIGRSCNGSDRRRLPPGRRGCSGRGTEEARI